VIVASNRTFEEIAAVLAEHVAKKTGARVADVERDRRFDHHGLDSADAVRMIGDLEDFVGRPLSAALPYKYPTIASLARRLADGASD
jgi:acyl carrier protein